MWKLWIDTENRMHAFHAPKVQVWGVLVNWYNGTRVSLCLRKPNKFPSVDPSRKFTMPTSLLTKVGVLGTGVFPRFNWSGTLLCETSKGTSEWKTLSGTTTWCTAKNWVWYGESRQVWGMPWCCLEQQPHVTDISNTSTACRPGFLAFPLYFHTRSQSCLTNHQSSPNSSGRKQGPFCLWKACQGSGPKDVLLYSRLVCSFLSL